MEIRRMGVIRNRFTPGFVGICYGGWVAVLRYSLLIQQPTFMLYRQRPAEEENLLAKEL